ncbi:MAG: NADP-dependent oxidoreductase, partial [Pseudomonadota bacterium]
MTQATQIRLKKRADGVPQDDVWETTHDTPSEPGDGEIAVEVKYISVDPAMRGWIVDTPSYLPPVQIGEVMRAGGLGT